MADSDTANGCLKVQDKTFVLARCGTKIQISEEDYELVSAFNWRIQWLKTGHVYAYHSSGKNQVAMHRLILNAPPRMVVDHKDNNGLNNSRLNIRLCTPIQNQANRQFDKRNKLGIKGVSKNGNKYQAVITPEGKQIYLGRFNTPEEANAAYAGAAKILWGKFSQS